LNDELVGIAIETYTNEGYDPTQIQLMVGFLPDGTIQNTAVTQQKETPGLGTKMALPDFKDQFMGKHPAESNLTVVKDGGEIDAITAATITSRAYCDAVKRAYDTYIKDGGNN
jgi:electron transport complex protein RnfG